GSILAAEGASIRPPGHEPQDQPPAAHQQHEDDHDCQRKPVGHEDVILCREQHGRASPSTRAGASAGCPAALSSLLPLRTTPALTRRTRTPRQRTGNAHPKISQESETISRSPCSNMVRSPPPGEETHER